MGEYLSPGLFRQERSASAGAIAGVSTSTYATCGWLRKGPENEPILISGFDAFVEKFGTYWRNSYIPFVMAAFFQNQGARAYVSRVVPSDAVVGSNAAPFSSAAVAAAFYGRTLAATVDLSTVTDIAIKIDGGAAVQVDCVGATPSATTPTEIAAAIDAVAGISCSVGANNRMEITHDTPGTGTILFEEATSDDATAEILGLDVSASKTYSYAGKAAVEWTLASPWKGAYYNQLRMCIAGNNDYQDTYGGFTKFDVTTQEESAVGAADWEDLESFEAVVMDDDTDEHFISDVVNEDTDFCEVTAGAAYGIPHGLVANQKLAEWLGEGDAAEVTFSGTLRDPVVHFSTLSIVAAAITATDDGSGNLTGTGVTSGTINYTTGAYTITYAVAPADGVQVLATYYQEAVSSEVCSQLTSGADGTGPLTRGDVSDPALQADKEGIYAFDDIEEILNLSMPDFAGDLTVSNDCISYAENRMNVFVLLTSSIGVAPADAIKYVRNTAAFNTSYAGFYYPWVKIYDPITNDGRSVTVPPDGFVAGVFSRTDTNRNVGKAPAGLVDGKINGAVGIERVLNKGDRDLLYPARINPLASSPQTGRAVWGTRTLSRDAEWVYVPVRRLFMFCEQSIYNASFWIPFENNGPGLWKRIITQGNGFFNNIFEDNYLAGATPSEAWFIKCDSDNNPQSAIDAGLITADYYIAPNKPGEFVRLRFQQKINNS